MDGAKHYQTCGDIPNGSISTFTTLEVYGEGNNYKQDGSHTWCKWDMDLGWVPNNSLTPSPFLGGLIDQYIPRSSYPHIVTPL